MPALPPPFSSPVEGERMLWSSPLKIGAARYVAREQIPSRQAHELEGQWGCLRRELFACGSQGFARIIRAKNRYWCGFPGNKAATM
jgi:hypothetical protein